MLVFKIIKDKFSLSNHVAKYKDLVTKTTVNPLVASVALSILLWLTPDEFYSSMGDLLTRGLIEYMVGKLMDGTTINSSSMLLSRFMQECCTSSYVCIVFFMK